MCLIAIFKPMTSLAVSKQANNANIHRNAIVVDSHNDTMTKVIDEETWLPKVDIGKPTDFHIDIEKLKVGGLKVPFFAAFTEGYYNNNSKSISRTLALINALYWTEKNNSQEFRIVSTEKGIYKALKANKIAAIPTIEGGYSINENNYIELLNQYKDLRIAAIGLTWNFSNKLGEGAKGIFGDSAKTISPKGLTKLGENVVEKMNELGIIIDVSHMSEQTFWDVIKISKAPIMATHSGVYNLKNHIRNLNDQQLKALAKNGGVINIVLYPEFLTNKKRTYIADFVDHIDYVVKLIGVDYVGIGSDFDGADMLLDLKNASEFYKITDELIVRGYSNNDIKKILGENTLRVLKEVQELGEVKSNNHNLGIYIKPKYGMGKIISDEMPLLSAEIRIENGYEADNFKFKLIIDGIPYKPVYDGDKSILYHQVLKPLEEKFHVVSFTATDDRGEEYRKTKIIYIK